MKRGFTLVEIIVSMMIFSIVAVVALAALIKIVDANKKAQTTHDAVTNLSFALDAMTREMRSGTNYYCRTQSDGTTVNLYSDSSGLRYPLVNNCSGSLSSSQSSAQAIIFAFTSPNTITSGSGSPCRPTYAYRLLRPTSETNWTLEKAEQTTCIISGAAKSSIDGITYNKSGGDGFLPVISSNNVSINSYYARLTNGTLPLFTFSLSGYAGVKEQSKSYFTVQSSNAQRTP